MTVLVVAEHRDFQLSPGTLNTITAAAQLSDDVHVLIAGKNCEKITAQLQTVALVKEILVADQACYEHALAESLAPLIVKVAAQSFTHILAPATTFGKNILPRAAALLNVGQISDIIAVLDSNTYQRPIYAGNAIAVVRSKDPIQCLTVRTSAFAQAETGKKTNARIRAIDFAVTQTQSRFIRKEVHRSDRPDLSSARLIISGGRGLGDKKTFERLEKIADRLHAALGASRAAVDAGLAPNDWQVGQTGKIVAPNIYIAVGISGAIQHLAGMKDSKIIAAINKDPEAPIFQVADYGLVADIHEVLAEWESLIDTISPS